MSNGGAMSSLLGCALPDRIAAIAPVAVIISGDLCLDKRPMPIVAFMGTDDQVVPFHGGKVQCCGGATLRAAPDAMAGWAERNGCDELPDEERVGTEVRTHTWPGCDVGAETVFYIVDGGGHTWPGAIAVSRLGMTTTQIDASETIWEFFKAHPLPGA
jgi:polyhydroxybutyrate depolymerase